MGNGSGRYAVIFPPMYSATWLVEGGMNITSRRP